MKLCTSVLWYIQIIKKNRPQKFAPPGGRHVEFKYGATMTIVLPISPVLLHLGPTFKCLYLCFRCLGTFWQCQNVRRVAILDFKMSVICLYFCDPNCVIFSLLFYCRVELLYTYTTLNNQKIVNLTLTQHRSCCKVLITWTHIPRYTHMHCVFNYGGNY